MTKFIDITGQRFGWLVVIKLIGHNKWNQKTWLCQCDCGNSSVKLGYRLRCGAEKSCGCRQGYGNFRHGHARTISKRHPLYGAWKQMRSRCNNRNNANYKYYGALGVRVCERWNDFTAFIADVGNRPHNKTLDRIDSNGNYEPKNVRWATDIEQAHNKRKTTS